MFQPKIPFHAFYFPLPFPLNELPGRVEAAMLSHKCPWISVRIVGDVEDIDERSRQYVAL